MKRLIKGWVLSCCLLFSGVAFGATILPGFQQDWYINGAPDSTLELGQGGTIFVGDTVKDTTTSRLYFVTSLGSFDSDTQTYTGVTFKEYVFDSTLIDLGINQPRAWQTVSLAVNTARTPSATKDVQLKITADLTSTLLLAARLNLQIKTATSPDVWTTYDVAGLSALVTTTPGSVSLLIPANSTYRYTTSGTVSNISVFELSN